MENYDNTSSVLSISKKNLNCDDVSTLLQKMEICSSVISNKSIVYSDKKYITENGCQIYINGLKPKHIKKKIWKPLQNTFDLTCAHLEIKGNYVGCILNYIRPSECKN